MKKLLLIIPAILLVLIIYFVFQPSQVGVHVYNVIPSETTWIKEQFAVNTNQKLAMDCKDWAIPGTLECQGSYTAKNLIELIRYQNNLFNVVKNTNLDFSSVVSGSFIASLFD